MASFAFAPPKVAVQDEEPEEDRQLDGDRAHATGGPVAWFPATAGMTAVTVIRSDILTGAVTTAFDLLMGGAASLRQACTAMRSQLNAYRVVRVVIDILDRMRALRVHPAGPRAGRRDVLR
jgi:hypothetical protein